MFQDDAPGIPPDPGYSPREARTTSTPPVIKMMSASASASASSISYV